LGYIEVDFCEAIKEAMPVMISLMAEKSIILDVNRPKFLPLV
jgi:hypothetical protein